jgi:chromosome segregation ATPase
MTVQPISEAKSMKHKQTEYNNHETRIALLEQSIDNINGTMLRMEKRFDQIDQRFIDFEKRMDARFDKVDRKFEEMEKKLESFNNRSWTNFYWILATMFTLACAGAGALAKGFHWFS